MEGRLVIFKAIFTGLLENYSSRFNFVHNDLEKIYKKSNIEIKTLFSLAFPKFPRSDPAYQKIIDDLTDIGITDPKDILFFLSKTLKDTIKNKATIFVTLKNCCVDFDPSSSLSSMLIYYFSLLFLTDLICQIIAKVSHVPNPQNSHIGIPSSISINNINAYCSGINKLETPLSSDSSSISASNSPSNSPAKQTSPPKSNSRPKIQQIPIKSKSNMISSKKILNYERNPANQTVRSDLSSDTLNMLARTGSKFAFSEQFVPSVHLIIVKQWSVIFSYLSEKKASDLTEIYSMFSMTTMSDMTIPTLLARFVRLDLNSTIGIMILDKIIQISKSLLKKKILTNVVLESISFMLVTLPYNNEIYSKIYSFLNSTLLRKCKSLWDGRIFLLTNLYLRYTKIWNKFNNFFNKKILREAGNNERLPVSIRCFELIMMGRNVKYESMFWEWGHNPRSTPLSYIQFNSHIGNSRNSSQNSSLFMNNYFVKSDFSVCPKLFKITLVHLASLNFTHFITYITRQFLALSSDDPRFLVFLLIIPDINSSDFFDHCFSDINQDLINQFNSLCRERIIKDFLNSPSITDSSTVDNDSSFLDNNSIKIIDSNANPKKQHGVCIRDFTFLLETLTVENDQKLYSILEEFSLTNKFKILEIHHTRSQPSLEKLDLRSLLLRSLQYAFTKEDFNNQKIISIIIELSCHIENRIATAAFDLCWKYFPNQVDPNLFIGTIVHMNDLNDSEAVFVLYSFIYSSLKNSFGKVSIDNDLLKLVELHGFTLLSHAYPSTRSLGKGILDECSKRIKEKSLMSFINSRIDYIEKTVKKKILLYSNPSKYELQLPPAQTISLDVALFSHYYDVWLLFFAEILNILIASNFTPLFQFLDSSRERILENAIKSESPSCFGIILMFLSTLFHLPSLLASKYIDFSFVFTSFISDDSDEEGQNISLKHTESSDYLFDHRKQICMTIYSLLSSENEKIIDLGFKIIPLLHFSLHPFLIDVLSKVDGELLYRSIMDVSIMLRMPEVEWPFYKNHMPRLVTFIGNVQYLFIQEGLNSPRTLSWSEELEQKLIKYSDVIQNYCLILITMFNNYKDGVSEEIWPYSSRQVTIRFLINWATISSRSLKNIQSYSSAAVVTLTSIGPFITDSKLVEYLPLEYFASLESDGNSILFYLLHYHIEYILNKFIDSCYKYPRSLSDLFFNAIYRVIREDETNLIFISCGKLIYLACVYLYQERPAAQGMIKSLIKFKKISNLCDQGPYPNRLSYKNIPSIFMFSIEAVFDSFFNLMKMKNRQVSASDLIEAIRPWIEHIRLLPNQMTCSPYVIPLFNMFTPYEFLMQMVYATESVSEDQFRGIVTLWIDLSNISDHNDLIPLFLSDLTFTSPNKKMFEVLLETNLMNFPKLIAGQCSFAFYYHITNNKANSFENGQQWLGSLLSNALTRNWNCMPSLLLNVLHFSFLFRMKGAKKLFYLLSRNFNIECFEGQIPRNILKKVIHQFIAKIKENEYSIEEWGNEALKWVFGCSSLELVTISLIIYNQIMIPYDKSILYLMIRCVSYHLTNNLNDPHLNDFISECFYFFTKHYDEDHEVTTKFVSAFLDCGAFFESGILFETSEFFLRAIRDKVITDCQTIVSIIRPQMTRLETDDSAQVFLNEIIDLLHQDELEMIALPFKAVAPSVFTSLAPFTSDEIIEKCCESSLCKALVHYSMILTTASYFVQDSIYYITKRIADRISSKYENNKVSIAKIYKSAVGSISRCENAMSLIHTICTLMPEVSIMNVYNVYEWDRSIEDVGRIVKILVKSLFDGKNSEFLKGNANNVLTITDCHSYKQVANILFCETPPKILPYAANAELIEGMKRLRRKPVSSLRKSKKKRKIPSFDSMMVNSLSVVFSEYHDDEIADYTPIQSPKKLILEGINLPDDQSIPKSVSIENFLKSIC